MSKMINSPIGIKGTVRAIGIDTRKLPPGTGGDFDDLFHRDEKGTLRATYPEAITEDRSFTNKFLRRGISWFTYRGLYGHAGASANAKCLPEVDLGTNTKNPFRYLIFVGDDSGSPTLRGDAKVDWNESDGASNPKIPTGNSTPVYGIRGIALDDVAEATIKRTQVRYPTTSPYRTLEYTFYAKANVSAVQTGAKGMDNFAIKSVGIAYDIAAGTGEAGSQWGTRAVLGEYPTVQCGDGAQGVLTPGANFVDTNTVTIGGKVYTFQNTLTNVDGNVQLGISLTASLDNLKRAINLEGIAGTNYAAAMTAGFVNCGEATATTLTVSSKWQGGSTISLATSVGSWDAATLTPITKGRQKKWCHENYIYSPIEGVGKVTALHKYAAAEAVSSDGYVSSNEPSNTALLTYSSVAIGFTAATKRIQVTGAAFTSAHIRKTLSITGSSSNNSSFTIKRRIDADEVEVFETVVDESAGSATAVVNTRNTGDKVFDGRCENYGKVYENQFTYDQDSSGATAHGEKWISADATSQYVGRIWSSAKDVKYIRIVGGEGMARDYMPKYFVLQYLKAEHTGGSPGDPPWPEDNNDWVNYSGHDYSAVDQSQFIMDAGSEGYEYVIATPVSTKGIRVKGMTSYGGTGYPCHIQELLCGEGADSHAIAVGTSDVIRISTKNPVYYRNVTVPAVASTTTLTTIRDALIAALGGMELEGYINAFGFLMIRGTVAGNYSLIDLAKVSEGSTINEAIGLPKAGYTGRTGVTRPSVKAYDEAKVYIYTIELSGDYPEV